MLYCTPAEASWVGAAGRFPHMRDLLTTCRMLLAASVALAGAGNALAQGEFDMHFQGDAVNRARVDDRGGTAGGYSFEIEYDDADSNSENFCPHCRF